MNDAQLTPLVEMAQALLDASRHDGRRRILGITGEPGAGKSTLTAHLVEALGPQLACAVPMDGFHLADAPLRRLGRLSRKGAPDTFDADGYVHLLDRVAAARPGERSIWAPSFERDLEQPLAGALEIPSHVALVITEGNYLLLDTEPWRQVREMLDQVWYVTVDQAVRHERLIARHERFGKDPDAARAWALGPDEDNARLIAASAARADRILTLPA